MTAAVVPPSLDEALSEAIALVTDAARKAARPDAFRHVVTRAKVAFRAHGHRATHGRGSVRAIAAAFPEYAEAIRHAQDPTDIVSDAVLRHVGEVTAPPVPDPAAPVRVYEDGEECVHDDHNWRCTECGGLYDADCDHDFECGECGSDNRARCAHCDLQREGCRHVWRCEGCGSEDI